MIDDHARAHAILAISLAHLGHTPRPLHSTFTEEHAAFEHVAHAQVARFLELNSTSYGGWLSGILSGLVWILVWLMALGMLSERQDELTNKMEEDE